MKPRAAQTGAALGAPMHAYVRTDRFRQEFDDDEIGNVVLGEDCIAWVEPRGIAARLIPGRQLLDEVLSGDPATFDVRWSEVPPSS